MAAQAEKMDEELTSLKRDSDDVKNCFSGGRVSVLKAGESS